MKILRVVAFVVAALGIGALTFGDVLMALYGGNPYTCVSTAWTFGCTTPAVKVASLGAFIIVAVGLYLWGKYRGS